jgi:hypothetical protein
MAFIFMNALPEDKNSVPDTQPRQAPVKPELPLTPPLAI